MTEAQVGALAPVVPASTDAPAPDTTADPIAQPEGAQPDAPPEKMLKQSEVDKLVGKVRAQESRRAERIARAEAERDFYKQQYETRQPQQTLDEQEPDPTKFKDFDTYNRALIRFELKQELKAEQSKSKQSESAQQEARAESQRGETLRQKFAAAEAKYPDFREALADPDLPFNGAILAYVEQRKAGSDVAYHLATNRDEFMRIAALKPFDQVEALLALESKLTAAPAPTQTPAPIVPNAGKASVRKDTFDLNANNSQEWDEFVKRRRKETGRR